MTSKINMAKMEAKERGLTLQIIFAKIVYDPETGIFLRKGNSRSNGRGTAGTICKNGYIHIMIGPMMLKAHRLAWFIVHGAWPIGMLDHINGDRSDNRICNLRPVTSSQNKANGERYVTNKSGYKGVIYRPDARGSKKWRAQITVNYKRIALGYFHTAEQASAAYQIAACKHFGEFARSA